MHKDARGIVWKFRQSLLVSNPAPFTLRGLHYQVAPFERAKIVHVLSGKVQFVRVNIKTHEHDSQILQAGDLTVVERFQASGYLTLAENTVIFYEMSVPHAPECERGFCFDDPALGIKWQICPEDRVLINERDRTGWPLIEVNT